MHSLSAGTPSAEVEALTTAKTAHFTLKNENSGVSKRFAIEPHPPFSARSEHQVVDFKEKLWLIGGDAVGGRSSDVWSSEDGINWRNALHERSISLTFSCIQKVVADRVQRFLV